MTTTTDPALALPHAGLEDVIAAYAKRRTMASRLADQDRYIGSVVREARAKGHSWADMARAVGVSDVAILKAARRKDTS